MSEALYGLYQLRTCDIVKLPGHPVRLLVPLQLGNQLQSTKAKAVGMVIIQQLGIIGSQALRDASLMGAVHRLDGSGLITLSSDQLKI